MVVFYGLGTILGAGIYVLVGEVSARAGLFTPLSFIIAAVIAAFTAFSYAELSARLPKSAGEAVYVEQGTGIHWLSTYTGWSVVFTGIVSAATISRGFYGYLSVFMDCPQPVAIIALVLSLGALAAWGIGQSVGIAAVMTLIEIAGLTLVIGVAGDSLLELPHRYHEMIPPLEATAWAGIITGAFLAFFAFIGFEDIVNVAEEVRRPARNLPRAILLCMIISSVFYVLVSLVATLSLPPEELAGHPAPLALIVEANSHHSPLLISGISLFAVVNGALIQIVMASRVIYGMGRQGMAPAFFSQVSKRTRTPIRSTVLSTALVLVLALWVPLVILAQMTAFVILIVYILINFSLVRIKQRDPHPADAPCYPMFVPVTGGVICLLFILLQMFWGFG
jgi:amino acid transporter